MQLLNNSYDDFERYGSLFYLQKKHNFICDCYLINYLNSLVINAV